uniref:Snake toxin/toxin-like domain-containing protein n=1 Tax=Terrapene triunguis TaxID=2587831 RepID=A0A674J9W8_9SAUR
WTIPDPVLASAGSHQISHSLVCFTCKDASSNWGCLAPTICRSGENYCVTTYLGAGIGKQCQASSTPWGAPYLPLQHWLKS